MLPVDLMVELLLVNRSWDLNACYVVWDAKGAILTHATNLDELRTEIRAYLLTLVPPPKLLSECEEGAWFESIQPVQRYAGRAYNPMGLDIGLPSDIQVIQPVEVNREL